MALSAYTACVARCKLTPSAFSATPISFFGVARGDQLLADPLLRHQADLSTGLQLDSAFMKSVSQLHSNVATLVSGLIPVSPEVASPPTRGRRSLTACSSAAAKIGLRAQAVGGSSPWELMDAVALICDVLHWMHAKSIHTERVPSWEAWQPDLLVAALLALPTAPQRQAVSIFRLLRGAVTFLLSSVQQERSAEEWLVALRQALPAFNRPAPSGKGGSVEGSGSSHAHAASRTAAATAGVVDRTGEGGAGSVGQGGDAGGGGGGTAAAKENTFGTESEAARGGSAGEVKVGDGAAAAADVACNVGAVVRVVARIGADWFRGARPF
jgi:hypothetical protein